MIAHARQLPDGAEIAELIDNHVLEMVVNDQMYRLETLLINSYDHLLDIRGTKRNKTAIEIAEIKQLSHIVRFLSELDKYKVRYVHSDVNLESDGHIFPLPEFVYPEKL